MITSVNFISLRVCYRNTELSYEQTQPLAGEGLGICDTDCLRANFSDLSRIIISCVLCILFG